MQEEKYIIETAEKNGLFYFGLIAPILCVPLGLLIHTPEVFLIGFACFVLYGILLSTVPSWFVNKIAIQIHLDNNGIRIPASKFVCEWCEVINVVHIFGNNSFSALKIKTESKATKMLILSNESSLDQLAKAHEGILNRAVEKSPKLKNPHDTMTWRIITNMIMVCWLIVPLILLLSDVTVVTTVLIEMGILIFTAPMVIWIKSEMDKPY